MLHWRVLLLIIKKKTCRVIFPASLFTWFGKYKILADAFRETVIVIATTKFDAVKL